MAFEQNHNAPLRRWLGFSFLMLPVLLVTIDNTILSFALPRLSEALNPSASQQLWIIDAYSLVLAGLLVSMGGIGDRIGHRKLLLAGSLGFATISGLVALSKSPEQLIAGRALMGVFGAMLMPSTLALIRSVFHEREQRRLAVAIWATTLTVGSALGPLAGGLLLQWFHWSAIFLIAIPLLLPLLLLGPLLLPESEPEPGNAIDPASILLSLLAMSGIIYAGKNLAIYGLAWPGLAAAAIGLLASGLFVRRQLHHEQPLLDLKLFGNRAFTGSILINLLSLAFLIGFVFFATQVLQISLGLSAPRASLALVPGQVMAIFIGVAIVPLARRMAARHLISMLLAIIGLAFALVACFGSGLATLVVAFALLNIGVGAITTVSNDLVLSAVPAGKAGAASAISETAYEVGVVLGTTLLGGIVTAYYRHAMHISDWLAPAQAAVARETLAGAFTIAGNSQPELAGKLIAAATESFAHGITMMSWITVGLVGLAIAIALRTLHHPPEAAAATE
ncbi:MFS transporter [Chromobacterium piscinae]|nr:MFS transporter [Chromobacterium piscinae]